MLRPFACAVKRLITQAYSNRGVEDGSGLSDADPELLLFPGEASRAPRRPQPNWAALHAELKRPGVTLRLLWEEYRAAHPDGYSLSRFCELYQALHKPDPAARAAGA